MNKIQGATKKTFPVRILTEDGERQAWEAAAAADGRSLSGWVRKACAEKLSREKAGADEDCEVVTVHAPRCPVALAAKIREGAP